MDWTKLSDDERLVAEQAVATYRAVKLAGEQAPHGRGLACLEQAVREHAGSLESPEGKLVEVDRPLLPSPTVARRTDELRRELAGFLGEAGAVREQVRAAGQGPAAGAALGQLARRARALVGAVGRYEEEEAQVILDGVTTDIGAGD